MKLTDTSWLNLATDSKTCNKPSDLRPFFCIFLTLISSSISTLVILYNSPSINYSCWSSYFFALFQLSPYVKTFDNAKDIPISAQSRVESSMKNTNKSILMFSNPNSSKKSMLASIPVYFYAVMPYFSVFGIFFFKDSSITNFLDGYSQMCTNYHVNK